MSSSYGKLKPFHQGTPKVYTHSFDERVKVARIRFELKKKYIQHYVETHRLFRSAICILRWCSIEMTKYFSPGTLVFPSPKKLPFLQPPRGVGGGGTALHRLLKNQHYYHYTRPNDKLPSLKCCFSRAKRQSAGCKWNLQSATWFHVKQSLPYEINLYDLALCIDDDDNHMTFGGH